MSLHSLSEEQKAFYDQNGYLIGLHPVFEEEVVKRLNNDLHTLSRYLEPGETLLNIREWHMSSKWLYDVCTHPQLLKYVEGILGPNFFLWGSQFFAKAPHSKDTVTWHQDAYYWPLEPHNSVTVWLAFTDVDEENGAMKVVPGTHQAGLLKHSKVSSESVLTLELDKGTFEESNAVSLVLRAGQVSLHDDAIVHGSPANHSDRWRIGLTIRYSGTNVKCDLSKAPTFKAYVVHGEDTYHHNPYGVIPTEQFARLQKEQHIASTDSLG